ncbi:Solute carrier family 13 member 2 [Acromyrmex echinatior]|uniref:Solute carrier family 13 member 2 n=1 Tax=Acromyrmex echinatior TaxID=103372 RepID=F4WQD3_ACREC|nr:Solute carrier family 13 member 2 [Acromyrmex echinatior]
MPWSLMFLLGGGFAISRGSVASSMARRVGEALVPLRHLPPIVILAVVCLFEGFATEFTSNVGVANITLPVIAQMQDRRAQIIQLDNVYYNSFNRDPWEDGMLLRDSTAIQPLSATRVFPEATNPNQQLYSSNGDAHLTLCVLILPLSSSAIFLTTAILENTLVSGDSARALQIVYLATTQVRPIGTLNDFTQALVNISSLLVEALPRFERQRQFVSAMISKDDLHVTRWANNVDSNFQKFVARIRQIVTSAQ